MAGHNEANTDNRLAQLRQVSFCAGLPDATVAALAAIAIPLLRPAGTVVQVEGDPAEAMYIVVRGRVKISRIGSNGREQLLNVIPAGGHFNTVPIFDGGTCPANAQAITDVTLLVLPADAMRRVVELHPPLALALLKEFTGRVRHLVNLVDELSLHTVQGRLAGLLLSQAAAAEQGDPAAQLTQAEMAAHLGTVREMVGRALKAFEALGLIRVDRGVITLLDRAGLEAQREQ
jgi:CRP-like cAMP-binding protein